MVVVVEPAAVVEGTEHGLRSLFVALTRCTTRLVIVHARPLPPVLGLETGDVPNAEADLSEAHDGTDSPGDGDELGQQPGEPVASAHGDGPPPRLDDTVAMPTLWFDDDPQEALAASDAAVPPVAEDATATAPDRPAEAQPVGAFVESLAPVGASFDADDVPPGDHDDVDEPGDVQGPRVPDEPDDLVEARAGVVPGDGDDPGGLAAPQRLEPAAVEAAAEVEPAEPGPAVTLAAPAPDTAGSTMPAPRISSQPSPLQSGSREPSASTPAPPHWKHDTSH